MTVIRDAPAFAWLNCTTCSELRFIMTSAHDTRGECDSCRAGNDSWIWA